MSLNVSPELHSLVMSMLDANPSARPSAEEVNRQVAQLWSKDPIDTKMDRAVSLDQDTAEKGTPLPSKHAPWDSVRAKPGYSCERASLVP